MAYNFTMEQVLDAIKGSFGIMSKVARALDGCAWHTAEAWVNKWATTRQAYKDEEERALDVSESQLIQKCNEGDGPMIRFHLATKGKQRGYTERHEVTGAEGGAVRVIFDEPAELRGGNPLSGAEAASGAKDSL
jgi:hypothetical protein